MRARSAFVLVPVRFRPIVDDTLLAPLIEQALLVLAAFEDLAQGLKPLTFRHPAPPMHLEFFLTVANDLLLRLHSAVEARQKIPVILPVHGIDGGRYLSMRCIVVAIGVEFAELLALFVEVTLHAPGRQPGLALLGLCQCHNLANS